MRLYKSFALLSFLYIITELILNINSMMGYRLPDMLIHMMGILAYLLFLPTYVSLAFILAHFGEQRWPATLLCTYLSLTVIIFLSSVVQVHHYAIVSIHFLNTSLVIAFTISLFYVKAGEVAQLFKWLAILMLITSSIKAVVALLAASYHWARHMVPTTSLLAIVPVIVILLLNRKMSALPAKAYQRETI